MKRPECKCERLIYNLKAGPKLQFLFENLVIGEVYLFHRTDSDCHPGSSLWGVFDKCIGTGIYLKSSSFDLYHFELWHPLPPDFQYCRLSTRRELRDYVVALVASEIRTFFQRLQHGAL